MVDILRIPDDVIIVTEQNDICRCSSGILIDNWYKHKFPEGDAHVRFEKEKGKLHVYLRAEESFPEFVMLRWNCHIDEPVKVLGDTWERAYANLGWRSLNTERFLPWYFFVTNTKGVTTGCGVMVQPNSFVCFELDSNGISCWFDVRCGAVGVRLDGRELKIGTLVCETYAGMSSFEAAANFCKVMSPSSLLPKEPVYGGNNWYYSYGKSSGEEIRRDASLIAELTKDCLNRPFMVIDDGWEKNECSGPWIPNAKFGDMKKIADSFMDMGVKPGLWVRLLRDLDVEKVHPDWLLATKGDGFSYLDPSHPGVQAYLSDVITRIRKWGYMLLKHDYSTYDIFGSFGFNLNGMITNWRNWSFYDRTKTSAEIVLDFYRTIRKVAGDMIIIGCNTISHLCAGLFEVNRTGDDTSGKYWSRTRALGVNTLAFRLPQNKSFYMVDADCVGILGCNIPWELNRQWAELLARSGTPLFISCKPDALSDDQKNQISTYFGYASLQDDIAEPLDWEYNDVPQIWRINGEVKHFDWVMKSYPALLKGRTLPI